jgi:2-oxo-hept-3-ene-1,7-dioate hydratase/2-keto-4-pentenoate hydratase
MLTEQLRGEIVSKIYRCFQEKTQRPLLTKSYPDIEVEDAYHIQEQVVASLVADGCKIKGYKIGLTSPALQELAESTEPDDAAIPDDMFIPEGSTLSRADWFDPLVAIEIAFVMKERLQGPGVTIAEVIQATDFVLPAIEVVDFRVARAPGMDVRDTIADLAAVGGEVLGGNPLSLNDIDIRTIQGSLFINGKVREEGASAEVLARMDIDWLCFDLHYGLIDYGDPTRLPPAVCGLPITPLVRVAANQPDQIGKALTTAQGKRDSASGAIRGVTDRSTTPAHPGAFHNG